MAFVDTITIKDGAEIPGTIGSASAERMNSHMAGYSEEMSSCKKAAMTEMSRRLSC